MSKSIISPPSKISIPKNYGKATVVFDHHDNKVYYQTFNILSMLNQQICIIYHK